MSETPQTPETVHETPPIAADLLSKINYLKGLVGLDALLANCLFPGQAANDLAAAQVFLKQTHRAALAEAETHRDFARWQAANAAQPKANRATRRSKS